MQIDKVKISVLQLIIFVAVITTFFLSRTYSRVFFAIFIAIYTYFVKNYYNKRHIKKAAYVEANTSLIIFGIIFVLAAYLLGLYFEFVISPYKLGFKSLFINIIPISVIIYCTEVIRYTFLSEKLKVNNVITFIIMFLIDGIILMDSINTGNLNGILAIVGYVMFSSFFSNMLYNHISPKYGYKGIVIYRLITILYSYFIPFVPNIYMFLKSFLGLLYPCIIFLVFERTFDSKRTIIPAKYRFQEFVLTVSTVIISLLIIFSVSGNFKYTFLVVGSGSMSGTIEMGDIVLYEETKDVKENDIIVFHSNDVLMLHRIINQRIINGRPSFYTKGDANDQADDGFRISDDIEGKVIFKIPKIGYINIWLRDAFNHSKK